MTCGANMEFQTAASACPATCVDPKAPEDCPYADKEGCVCKEGFILSGETCVSPVECGCYDEKQNYYPVRVFL